jgi:hypothetical protein
MTALLLENMKLVMLFVLIGAIIGLSRFSDASGKPARSNGRRAYRSSASAHL